TGETRLKLKKGINALDYPVSFSARSMQRSILRLGVQRSDHAIFSPDGRVVAAWNWNEVALWDTTTGGEIQSFTKFNHQLQAIAFSPDSKTLVTAHLKTKPSDYWRGFAGLKSEIHFYDVATGNTTRTLAPRSPSISSLTFDLTGKTLVVGGWDSNE